MLNPKRVPKTTLAWLAALIDGEGSIMLLLRKASKRIVYRQPHYRASVAIAMTDERLANAIIERTGIERVYSHGRKGVRHRTQYTWRMTASEIKVWLPCLIPWLVLKREQATLLLEALKLADLCTPRKGEKWDRSVVDASKLRRDEIYAEIRKLNNRGFGSVPEWRNARTAFLADNRRDDG